MVVCGREEGKVWKRGSVKGRKRVNIGVVKGRGRGLYGGTGEGDLRDIGRKGVEGRGLRKEETGRMGLVKDGARKRGLGKEGAGEV